MLGSDFFGVGLMYFLLLITTFNDLKKKYLTRHFFCDERPEKNNRKSLTCLVMSLRNII